MKHKRSEYIIHGLFIDDMMLMYLCDQMNDVHGAVKEGLGFDITRGLHIEAFLVMEVVQRE